MAATDLDPLFVRALKLLNSKSKESAAQLKAMVDEAIAQRKGLKVPAQSGDAGKMSPARYKDDDYKRKEVDKRSHEKGGKDASEPDIKKSKLDTKHRSKDEKDARDKEREREKVRRDKDRKEKEEKEAQRQKEKAEKERKEKGMAAAKQENEVTMVSDDEEEMSQLDAGDFALEMGIACVVCKQFGVSSGNQLVECQECHSLYHQECHKPPVAEETVNDPRYVWYCSRCQKMLQKKQQQAAQKPVAKPPKSSAPLMSGKDSSISIPSSTKPFKTEAGTVPIGGVSSSSSSQAFRKMIDPKVMAPPKDTNSQSKPILGLAGLAANLTKPQSKSGSSHRKADHKGGDSSIKTSKIDGSKPASKVDGNSHSSKPKNDEKRPDKFSSSEKDRKYESGSSKSSSSSREEKKSSSAESLKSSSSSSSSSSAFDKSDKKTSDSGSSKSEKKAASSLESSKALSSSSSSGLRLDISAASMSMSAAKSSPSQPETPDSASVSAAKLGVGGQAGSSSSSDKNKKAVAALSMITANKRMQMMMKKAQAKPSDKKVHIK